MILFLGALLLCVAPARGQEAWPDLRSPARAIGGGDHDAAVIVGVEDYAFVPPVPGAEANAKAWYDYLTKTRSAAPGNVKLLLGNDAAREDMLAAAQKAAAKAGPDGTLWFVFIGHGAPSSDGKDGLLVAFDAQQKAESLQTHSLRRGELLKALRASKAAKIVVLVDACFSGRGPDGASIAPGLQPLVTVASFGAVDSRMVVMTAAKGDQFAGGLPGAQRPAFSYLVLGGLRGWAGQAQVTAGDLWHYASDALDATLTGRNQTPDLIGREALLFGATPGEKGPDLAALAKATAGGGMQLKNPPAAPRARAPKEQTAAAAPGKAGIQWVRIPGGSFIMGAADVGSYPQIQHRVAIKSFEMAKTLTTNKQYRACVAAGACTAAAALDSIFEGDDQPVVGVDWSQAKAFAEWAGGRLPSESEWEYAARSGGKDRRYPWGNEEANCSLAVISGCGNSTAPVCSKTEGNTQQGLCDMAGNAWEWVQDWYHPSYAGAPSDGSAWEDGGVPRVYRGGAWYSASGYAQAAYRDFNDPDYRFDGLGFRVAR
ncbi:MAG: SUMF1/EgtB/PvdO family nonheme iron enzyme [Elusimicrobiota bacterium]